MKYKKHFMNVTDDIAIHVLTYVFGKFYVTMFVKVNNGTLVRGLC